MNLENYHSLIEEYQNIYYEEKKPFPFQKVNKQMRKAEIKKDHPRAMQMKTAVNRAKHQGQIPPSDVDMAMNKRVRLIRGLTKENFDDLLDYLISEKFCDNEESASNIIESMSLEWMESIVEAKYGTDKGRKRLSKKNP